MEEDWNAIFKLTKHLCDPRSRDNFVKGAKSNEFTP